ncbi:hypothetical protein Bequi_13360 [Brachybacterium sp. JHP9]|uniref:Uncharacterized protein n=1 Tax=Brachybacterium equifaecis TaxID=2910770 RepID=A0ABT0R4E1_9MICO|nr:hypothetical protein [Brachybacterium equifaecis]MCL6424353.1 hypothetical protein [Brachybacterium equifaecis]
MSTKLTSAERKADRSLCPVPISSKLDLRVHDVAEAMRAAGETQQLTMDDLKSWRRDPESVPAWLVVLEAERELRRARSSAKAEARREREAARTFERKHERVIRTAHVIERLERGATRFRSELDREIVEGLAFEVSKELVRGTDPSELDAAAVNALKAVGVSAFKHKEWIVHAGGCEGTGRTCMDDAIARLQLGKTDDLP